MTEPNLDRFSRRMWDERPVRRTLIKEVNVDMGQAAEDILNGLMCEGCGSFIDGEEPGYPRKCEDCE